MELLIRRAIRDTHRDPEPVAQSFADLRAVRVTFIRPESSSLQYSIGRAYEFANFR